MEQYIYEKDIGINEAQKLIADRLRRATKKNHRRHKEARDQDVQRQRALDNICSQCIHLKITTKPDKFLSNLNFVRLRCEYGFNPIDLMRQTPSGQEATCPGFSPKQLRKINN